SLNQIKFKSNDVRYNAQYNKVLSSRIYSMNSNNKYVVNQVYGSGNRNNVQFNNANRYNRYNQLQFNATKCPNNRESFVRGKNLIKSLMHPLLELTNPKNQQINNHRTVQISKTSGIDVKLPKFHQQTIP